MRLENGELRAFRAVVEEGGFGRAAEALHLSQSAISQAVAGLEAKLETPLIQRGKSLGLTPAGKRLLDHAVEVLRGEQQTLEEISALRRGHRDTLSLALSASLNYFHAKELVSAYCDSSPDVTLRIQELPSRNIIYAVLGGTVELGLGPFQKHMSAFTTLPLYRDTRHLVVSPRHPEFAAMVAGEAAALKRTPLIASALDNPDMRPSIQRLRDQFSTVWEISSLSLRIHLVARGLGVTFLDRRLLQEHPQCRDLQIMDDLSFGRIDKQVGLYHRAGQTLSGSAHRFIDLCADHWGL